VKNLIERIRETRATIKKLTLERNAIQKEIDKKKLTLEELEKLTVNQITMFEK